MVPITLITGFLGSGKTTFINWILEKSPELKISVILNEFGSINLESQFITAKHGDVIELANGCMCCVAKSDIPRIVKLILEKSPETEHILIEASGLSDPGPIVDILTNGDLTASVSLHAILCMVDTLNFASMVTDHPIMRSQLADADLVVLTKLPTEDTQAATTMINQIHTIVPMLRVIPFSPSLTPELFFATTRDHLRSREHTHAHEHYQDFLFHTDSAMRLAALSSIIRTLPDGIIRAKGVIATGIHGERKMLLQHIGNKTEWSEDVWGADESHSTNILFVGTSFDQETLATSLHTCEGQPKSNSERDPEIKPEVTAA